MGELFASSPYFEEAGLDWKEYYAAVLEDHNAGHYSQHAAAFVLTLLPNLKVLTLPNIRCLWLPKCVSTESGHSNITSKYLHCAFISSIEEIHLGSGAFIDEVAIANLLKHTPHLKELAYWHLSKGTGSQNWDLCQFITAIQSQVGGHLETLSINIGKSQISASPSKPSMSGFQQLQRLELPLETAVCGLAAAALDGSEWLISDLVPASVSQLSLISRGTDNHANALHGMFHDFATRRPQLPNLEEIHSSYHPNSSEMYKVQYAKLDIEAKMAGVALKRRPYTGPTYWTDDDEFIYESDSE